MSSVGVNTVCNWRETDSEEEQSGPWKTRTKENMGRGDLFIFFSSSTRPQMEHMLKGEGNRTKERDIQYLLIPIINSVTQ